MKTGKYDKVLNYFGKSVEHYGKKNAPTYFAEKCFQNDILSVLLLTYQTLQKLAIGELAPGISENASKVF